MEEKKGLCELSWALSAFTTGGAALQHPAVLGFPPLALLLLWEGHCCLLVSLTASSHCRGLAWVVPG